jgi:hypothetical protein
MRLSRALGNIANTRAQPAPEDVNFRNPSGRNLFREKVGVLRGPWGSDDGVTVWHPPTPLSTRLTPPGTSLKYAAHLHRALSAGT